MADISQISECTFDPKTGVMDFGKIHIYYAFPDAMLRDAGIEHLVEGFITIHPEKELAFAQRQGASLAPGGSGYQFHIPTEGFSQDQLDKIQYVVRRFNEEVIDRLKEQARSQSLGELGGR